MTFGGPLCVYCMHLYKYPPRNEQPLGFSHKCDAFPEAIPEDIIQGEVLHEKPYPGDHGIRFEPNQEFKDIINSYK